MNQARGSTDLGRKAEQDARSGDSKQAEESEAARSPAAATPANTLSANVSAANATCIGSNSRGFRAAATGTKYSAVPADRPESRSTFAGPATRRPRVCHCEYVKRVARPSIEVLSSPLGFRECSFAETV